MGCIFTRELDSHAPFPGFKGGSRRASRTATARHPYLGGNERAVARLVRQHLVKKVGTPRGRGPIFAAEPPLFRIRTLLADGAARLRLGTTRSSSLHLERRGHPPMSLRKMRVCKVNSALTRAEDFPSLGEVEL